MEWNEWEALYEEILKDFGYEKKKDEEAARIAANIARSNVTLEELRRLIEGNVVSICGAGRNLDEEIEKIEGIIMAADEATSFLLLRNIIPHIVTTDLDGNVEDILKVNESGCIVAIHAHGDNIEALKEWLPLFRGKILITCQSKPFDTIYNFGGFTDGDRAYCMAKHFKAEKIKLIGFDFEKPREKEGKDMEVKRKKLRWAKRIISEF